MGGTVAETIRKESGEIIKMARRTGAYNWMIFSKAFNTGKTEEAITEHLEAFLEMKEDYESGKPYKLQMTEFYGWCNETAPTGYGLVVLDFKNKKIHGMQGYDSPGKISGVSLSTQIIDDESRENYKFLFDNNLLEVYSHDNRHLGDVHSIFGSNNPYEKLQEDIEESYALKNESAFFKKYQSRVLHSRFMPKCLKDFEIIRYDETPEGLIKMLTSLKEEGFQFNDEEIKMWKEFNEPESVIGFDGKLDEEQISELEEKEYDKYAKESYAVYLSAIDAIINCSTKTKIKP